jgi:hypothetical protein
MIKPVMKTALFRTMSFPVEDSEKCACVIAGYRGRIASYKKVIEILNNRGFSVIAYEHIPGVLSSGDPQTLLKLVKLICDDFHTKSSDYKEVICIGASIGAGLCFAIQKQTPNVKYGIYAGAGVSPPENIFEVPLFYFVRKKFSRLGYTKLELKKVWSDIDIVPTKLLSQTPFVIALGKRDRIVKYGNALSTLNAWQDKGQPIKIITKPKLGHFGIIRWYKKHIEELIVEAEVLTV